MGLLDDLRDRLRGDADDYDDDYYDDDYDDYEDDDYEDDDYDEPQGSGLLGNTPRPEAESVAVYTRSGRPVSTNAGGTAPEPPASRTASAGYASSYRDRTSRMDESDSSRRYTPQRQPASYNASGQLPPYVLRAEAYEDVQTVVRRVRTNQTVLLDLSQTPHEDAQRILDFCFGLAFGIDGEVTPMGDKSFAVLPAGMQLSAAEAERLLASAR